MTDPIVVGDRVLLDVKYRAVWARLVILAMDGMLRWASEAAYGDAITGLVKAAGPEAGLTRLAEARLQDLTGTNHCSHVTIQWEAIAADGTLFTALDADLMLVPAGRHTTELALAGAYRPQPGPAGDGLDQAMVRESGMTAIRSFLARVACTLAHPAGTAGDASGSPRGWPTATW